MCSTLLISDKEAKTGRNNVDAEHSKLPGSHVLASTGNAMFKNANPAVDLASVPADLVTHLEACKKTPTSVNDFAPNINVGLAVRLVLKISHEKEILKAPAAGMTELYSVIG